MKTQILLLALLVTGMNFLAVAEDRGTEAQDEDVQFIVKGYKAAPKASSISEFEKDWNCSNFSALTDNYTATHTTHAFKLVGHLMQDFPNAWAFEDGELVKNILVTEKDSNGNPKLVAYTSIARKSSKGKLYVETMTSDADYKAVSAPAVADSSLNAVSYSYCY